MDDTDRLSGVTPLPPPADDAPAPERSSEVRSASRFRPTPVQLRPLSVIPPREWLYGHHLVRGFVSVTVAPGGVGKSALAIAEAVAMASGRPLLGDFAPRPLKVWFWCGEDPADEIERRIGATCAHYGITEADLGGRLMADTGRAVPIRLAEESPGLILALPVVDALVEAIRVGQIDVLVIDPFVTTHGVNENDNAKLNAVVSLWRTIADRAGCAVELIHHSTKAARVAGMGEALGAAQARGAGALIDAARDVRVLVPMESEEAAKAGLPSHRGFFRIEHGKANLAPPPDKATWRRLASVPLGNGTDLYPEGDFIGVAETWEWPDAFDGVAVADAGRVRDALAGAVGRASEQSPEWAGGIVADVLHLDIGPLRKGDRTPAHHAARAKVRGLLAGWIKTGELVEVPRRDTRTGRDVPMIRPFDRADDAPECHGKGAEE